MINATFQKTVGPDDATRMYSYEIPDGRVISHNARTISKLCEHNVKGCAHCSCDKPIIRSEFGVERVQLSRCPRTSDTH